MRLFFIKIRKWLIYFAVIVSIFTFAFWLALLAKESSVIRELVSSYGYMGIFVVSVFSGFNFVVPIPAISFLPLFLESGFNLWFTIFIMSLGMTLADVVAYIFGVLGRRFTLSANNAKIIARMNKLRSRHYWAPVVALFFFAAFIPLPNEFLMVPLGFMGYNLRYIFPVIFLGNTIFNIFTAFGVISLFNIL